MMALQTKKRTGAALFFALTLLTCTPAINAGMFSNMCSSVRAKATLSNAAWFTLFLAFLRFYTREGNNEPSRYNLDELLVGENVTNNIWYLIDDLAIGNAGKKSVLKADSDAAGVIAFSESVKPRGLGGTIHAYYKPFLSALGTLVFMQILCETKRTAPEGKFAETFFANLVNKAKSLVKMSDLGLTAAANLVK